MIVEKGYYQSSFAAIEVTASLVGIRSIQFTPSVEILKNKPSHLVRETYKWLDGYFTSKQPSLNLPLDLEGSDFQIRVWKSLLNIPYGKTVSYQDIATDLGDRNATRAVGMANNKNKIAIYIPCHRVIGKDGSLVGYGGGLDFKKSLLRHEGALAQLSLF